MRRREDRCPARRVAQDRVGLLDGTAPPATWSPWFIERAFWRTIAHDMKFNVIQGDRKSTKPRHGRRKSLTQSEQIICWACENRNGYGTSRLRKATVAPRRRPDGTIFGGTQMWICDYCGRSIQPVK